MLSESVSFPAELEEVNNELSKVKERAALNIVKCLKDKHGDLRGFGSARQGCLKVNQFIEVLPGIVVKDKNGNIKCTLIYFRIVSLYAEQNELQFAIPGGLIGVGTTMDLSLTHADRLVG